MTEIEQLRQDIATLEAAERLASGMPGRSHVAGAISSIVYDKRAELAKLKAEAAAKADPHKHAKVLSGRWLVAYASVTDENRVAKYVCHLEQRIAELEAEIEKMFDYRATHKGHQTKILELQDELAKRPAVWQLRDRRTGEVRCTDNFGQQSTAIYSDAEIEHLKTLSGWVAFTNDYAVEPYTGEQS